MRFFILVFLLASIAVFGQVKTENKFLNRVKQLELSQPDLAYVYADSALSVALKENNDALQAEVYFSLGNIFYHQGSFSQAMDYYLESQKYFVKTKQKEGEALCNIQLGKVYYYIMQPRQARLHFNMALHTYNAIGSKRYIGEIGGSEIEDIYVKGRAQLDLTGSYTINSKIRVFAEVLNVSNQPFSTYQGDENTVIQREFYGWWTRVGIKFNL